MANVKHVLIRQSLYTTGITGHSSHIGIATAAAQACLEDSLIQTLDRWHSAAFLRYIQTPTHVLVTATTRLIPQSQAMQQHLCTAHQVQGGADPSPTHSPGLCNCYIVCHPPVSSYFSFALCLLRWYGAVFMLCHLGVRRKLNMTQLKMTSRDGLA